MQTKTCADCCVPKPLDQFGPTKQQLKFGVKSRCRDCEREYKRKWVKENPVRVKLASQKTYQTNREKVRAANREYHKRIGKEHPEWVSLWNRRNLLKRNYGLTIEQYAAMCDKQGGLCAICKCPPGQKGLCVDHCHITGKVRKLLCNQCNTGLHKMERDIDWIRKAEEYLKETC